METKLNYRISGLYRGRIIGFSFLYAQKRWAQAYTATYYHAAVNTNNGAEALNKVLKYKFLPRRKAITLSNLATLLVESYFPKAHRNYLCMNYLQKIEYRKYKSIVSEYVQDRTRSTFLHCFVKIKVLQAVLGVTHYNCNALRNNITLMGNELI